MRLLRRTGWHAAAGLTAVLGGVVLAGGCGVRGGAEGGEPGQPLLEDPSRVEVIVGDDRLFSQPQHYDRSGLGLRAVSRGPELILSAHNRGADGQFTIMRDDLAIITGPDPREDLVLVNPGTAEVSDFTPLFLNEGERGVLRFAMREYQDLSGMRLVYNNPRREIRFFVEIE